MISRNHPYFGRFYTTLNFDTMGTQRSRRLVPTSQFRYNARYNLRSNTRFSSFNVNSVQVPAEITRKILAFASDGESVWEHRHRRPSAIAQVSTVFRTIYPSLPSAFAFETPHHLSRSKIIPLVQEVLNFHDLTTMVSFFVDGPGRPDSNVDLSRIKYIRIVYIDYARVRPDYFAPYYRGDWEYAFEAFELLVENAHRMSLEQLELKVLYESCSFGVDSPGIWSLLRLRGLKKFYLMARRGTIRRTVRTKIRQRVQWKQYRKWKPLGLEGPGPGDWRQKVKVCRGQTRLEAEWAYLAARYKYLQDRCTIQERRNKQKRMRDRRNGVSACAKLRRRYRREAERQRQLYILA